MWDSLLNAGGKNHTQVNIKWFICPTYHTLYYNYKKSDTTS